MEDEARAVTGGAASEPLRTVAEAAAFYNVNPSTVWRWIDGGKLSAVRVGARSIRIRTVDLGAVTAPARPVAVVPIPTAAELARRQALVREIIAERADAKIAPMTAADLIHAVRSEEERGHGNRRA
jgi:excisionase family DNA binding protein